MASPSNHGDLITEFIDFLHARGIPPADSRDIIANDKTNRYTVASDKPNSKNGTYRLGLVDGVAMGWAKWHKSGETQKFISGSYKKLTPAEKHKLEENVKQRREDNKKRQHEQHEAAHIEALKLWRAAVPASADHPYLRRKKIPPGTLRQHGQDLLIPFFDMNRKLWNIQSINHSGFKLFLTGARVKGCYHQLGEPRPFRDDPFVICEGYATGMTIHQATKFPVIVAVQANNLLQVGCAIRYRYNFAKFIYAADNDKWTFKPDGVTPNNVGLTYAREAASQTGGRIITLPDWFQTKYEGRKPTDFNDMADILGIEAVAKMFETEETA